MRRWRWLFILCVLFAGTLFADTKPNVIVIMADDLGYSDLGCYGGEIQTPNIDQLALDGIRFTGLKNTSRCAPSRASLLTGRYQHAVGMGWMTSVDERRPGYRGQVSEAAPMMSEIFKAHGYATGVIGKWHLTALKKSGDQKQLFPLDRGFDFFYGTWWGAKDYFSPQYMMKNRIHLKDGKYPKDYYLTDALSDSALAFVRKQVDSKQPFFLYLTHYAPHAPIQAPDAHIQKCLKRYQAGFNQLQLTRLQRQQVLNVIPADLDHESLQSIAWEKLSVDERNKWIRTMATYAAMIEIMDEGIGRLITLLKSSKQYENTLIIFLSDNGATPERKGKRDVAKLCAALSNTPFRGYKAGTYQGGVSSPMIMSWPKAIGQHAGSKRDGLCHIIDVLPTCLDAVNIPFPEKFKGKRPAKLDGYSLMAAVRRDQQLNDMDRPLFWEHQGSRAIYHKGWKLIAHGKHASWELYDLSADPAERDNLASHHPERVTMLKGLWTDWARKYHVLPLVSTRKERLELMKISVDS